MKYITLTQGKRAMVDDADFEWLNQYKWYYQYRPHRKTGYALRAVHLGFDQNHKRLHKTIYMHREVAKTPAGFLTDHKDGDGLNNQSTNLRISTDQQNKFNRGRAKNNTSSDMYKGAYWQKQIKRWYSRIQLNGKSIYLGTFDTAKDAAIAYNQAALKYHGEFAGLNDV